MRIHLDNVEQLGTFIELEAVAPPDSDLVHEHELISHLRTAFAITDKRLLATGYAKQLTRNLRASLDIGATSFSAAFELPGSSRPCAEPVAH